MKNSLKSIGTVVGGFLTVFILSVATDTVLEQIGIFPTIIGGLFSNKLLLIAFFYRSIYTVFGGYVTAQLAPSKPMKHVVILGIIGTLAGIAGVIAGWNLSQHWYPIALAVTGFPLTYLGGKIKK